MTLIYSIIGTNAYGVEGANEIPELKEYEASDFGSILSIHSCGKNDDGNYDACSRLNGWYDYMLSYITQGTLTFKIDNQVIIAHKNDVVIVPPNIPYMFEYQKGSNSLWMHFSGDALLKHLKLDEGYLFHIEESLNLESLFMQLILQMNYKEKYNPEITSSYGMLILTLFAKQRDVCLNKSNKPSSMDLALQAINTGFRGSAKISEYAKIVDCSVRTFSAKFKDKTGMTPNKYITLLRIESAKQSILTSHASLKKISEDNGYINYEYFVRVFREYVGINPRQYQKKAREELFNKENNKVRKEDI